MKWSITSSILFISTLSTLVLVSCTSTNVKQLSLKHNALEAAVKTVEVIPIQVRALEKTIRLPGELSPFESVDIFPKVSGFLQSIPVDRGSVVRQGQVLARLAAPEVQSQIEEAQSRVGIAQSEIEEAKAKYEASESTYQRLKKAAETPGVIAANELVTAQKSAEAARMGMNALQNNRFASQAAVKTLQSTRNYLLITAPFDGIVTTRNLHPGALVGPSGGETMPILHMEKISHLRLAVSVPEANTGTIAEGMPVHFTVPAYPDRQFVAAVSRVSHALDVKTRTEPIELDVQNVGNMLSPGMYADVMWPIRSANSAFIVPKTAIVSTTERTFVITVKDGLTRWIDVKRGSNFDDQVEIFAPLEVGDQIVARATDELRDGTKVTSKPAR